MEFHLLPVKTVAPCVTNFDLLGLFLGSQVAAGPLMSRAEIFVSTDCRAGKAL